MLTSHSSVCGSPTQGVCIIQCTYIVTVLCLKHQTSNSKVATVANAVTDVCINLLLTLLSKTCIIASFGISKD